MGFDRLVKRMRERDILLKKRSKDQRTLKRREELVREGLSPEDARIKASQEYDAQESCKKLKSLEATAERVQPTKEEAKAQLDKALKKETTEMFQPDTINSYMIGLSRKLEYSSLFSNLFSKWTAVDRLMYDMSENTIYVNGTEWEVSHKTNGKSKTRAKSVVENGVPGKSDHYWKIKRKGWGANRYFRLKQSSRTNIDDQAMLTKLMKKIQEVLGCQMS